MALYSSWIHGNALVSETNTNILAFTHYAWGSVAKVRANQTAFFHIPIPTPNVINDQRPSFFQAHLLFKTSEFGFIDEIQLWDGARNTGIVWDNLTYNNGEHLGPGVPTQFKVPGAGQNITDYVALSLTIKFLCMYDKDGELMISGAGGDFYA